MAHINGSLTLAGLVVGTLVGLTGLGGGSLMTPLLLLFNVAPPVAVGTDLLFAAITKIVGAVVHGHRVKVDWPLVRRLAYGSVPSMLLSLGFIAHHAGPSQRAQHIMLAALALMLALSAMVLLVPGLLSGLRDGASTSRKRVLSRTFQALATIMLGAVLGSAVALSSVGAGAVGVAVLLMLYPEREPAQIVGADMVHAVPLAALAGWGYWWAGDVDPALLRDLLIGSIPGVIAGSLLSPRTPTTLLKPLLGVVLALSSCQLLIKILSR